MATTFALPNKSSKSKSKKKKDAYFKCRAAKIAKNKKAWPHEDAKKLGTCREKFLAWQKVSPKAAKAWEAGLDAVVYAGDAEKADKYKDAYDKCRRKRKANKKDYYPQKVKGFFRLGKKSNYCKSSYVKWKKYQPTGSTGTASTTSTMVSSARTFSTDYYDQDPATYYDAEGLVDVAAEAGRKMKKKKKKGKGKGKRRSEQEFSPSADDFDDDEDDAGVPMWMIAAGAAGGLGLLWYLSGR